MSLAFCKMFEAGEHLDRDGGTHGKASFTVHQLLKSTLGTRIVVCHCKLVVSGGSGAQGEGCKIYLVPYNPVLSSEKPHRAPLGP